MLVDERRLLRAIFVEEGIERRVERWACINTSAVGGVAAHALFDTCVECAHIPAVKEIAVEAVASGVTVGEDEISAFLLPYIVDGVDNLEEQMRNVVWMCRWANTCIDSRHVGSMALVRLVEVDTVPTILEMNLSTEATGAVRLGETWCVWHWVVVVETCETSSISYRPILILLCRVASVGQSGGIIISHRGVARDKTETRGKCDYAIHPVATAEIVHHSASVGYVVEGTVLVAVVQLRSPVRALVVLNAAGRTVRGLHTIEGRGGVEV